MPDFWSINVADFYFPHIFITVQCLRCSNTKSLQRGLVLNAVSTLQNNHQHFQSNLLQMLERSQWLKMGRQFICLKLINLKSLSHLSPSSLVPLAPGLWKEEVFFEFDMRCNTNDTIFIWSILLLAPTGALILMMVYYIYIYIRTTFSDFEHLCLSILLQVSL